MSVFRELSLIVPPDLLDEVVSAWQVWDTLSASDHAALSPLVGEVRLTQQPTTLPDGSCRLSVVEEDCAPASWAPRPARGTLLVAFGASSATTTVTVSGAAVGDPVLVALAGAPSAGVLSAMVGSPLAWVSAPDTVTVTQRLSGLLSSGSIDVVVYVLPAIP